MEEWRRVWRDGAVPLLSRDNLKCLEHALESNDRRLLQGKTTSPPPMQDMKDWPVEGACLLGYVGVMELGGFAYDFALDGSIILPRREDTATVAEAEGWFSSFCAAVDARLNEPAASRHVLNAYDEMPREQMRREFLAEVQLALLQKGPTDEHQRTIA